VEGFTDNGLRVPAEAVQILSERNGLIADAADTGDALPRARRGDAMLCETLAAPRPTRFDGETAQRNSPFRG
jgi:hypothetical protein